MRLTGFCVLASFCFLALVKNDPEAQDFTEINYEQFLNFLSELKKSALYNKIIRITNGFETFQIRSVPFCSKDKTVRCQNPIIEIANFQKGNAYVKSLPTLLLVAGFHGDEVIGTNSLFYLIKFINSNYFKSKNLFNLLLNVRLLIVPMVNANGFFGFKRTETVVLNNRETETDPNRDFPFDQPANQKCFLTSTAELLDAVFRNNLIVGCLTFHGGDNSITYPWGNFLHSAQPQTGDHLAFDSVAKALKIAAGANPDLFIDTYQVGTLHGTVYDVHGGFEDWAYGASFDRNSINKSCGVRQNKKFDLVRNDIKYDQYSNKAFVYLVEAGQNKRPPSETYGNELPIATGDFLRGKWGHATRNMQLSLVFAQILAPSILLEKIEFTDSIYLHFKIHGCLRIDSLKIEKFSGKLLKTDIDVRKNEYSILVKMSSQQTYYPQINFQLSCDQRWAGSNHGNQPQSHFVRARTDQSYNINYRGFSLNSNKIITGSILNIHRDQLKGALIHSSIKNVFSLSYSSNLKASLASDLNTKSGTFYFKYQQGQLQIQAGKGASASDSKTIQIESFGSNRSKGKQLKTVQPRQLFIANSNTKYQISEQAFLDLAGRDLQIFGKNAKKMPYLSLGIYKNKSEKNLPDSYLLIPPNGLNCNNFSSERDPKEFRYVSVLPNYEKRSLLFTLFQRHKETLQFDVGGIKSEFHLIASFANKNKEISQFQAEIEGLQLNDMRIMLAKIRIYNVHNKVFFSCLLGQKNPNLSNSDIIDFMLPNSNEKSLVKSNLVLILFSLLLIFAICFWILKHIFRQKEGDKLEKTIHKKALVK